VNIVPAWKGKKTCSFTKPWFRKFGIARLIEETHDRFLAFSRMPRNAYLKIYNKILFNSLNF
jgi:hypothetical protein